MKKKTPKEPQIPLSLPRWFAPTSPVEPETQTTKEAPTNVASRPTEPKPTQEETERPEPSDNMPGEYAYKSKGVDKGETMHPNYRPTKKST